MKNDKGGREELISLLSWTIKRQYIKLFHYVSNYRTRRDTMDKDTLKLLFQLLYFYNVKYSNRPTMETL